MNAANMVRSLLPLVADLPGHRVVDQLSGRAPTKPVREVDPSSTVAAGRRPRELPDRRPAGAAPTDYRPTSARTDAGTPPSGRPGDPGDRLLTPSEEFAGFVVSDDRRADAARRRPRRRREAGTVEVGGPTWTRSTTQRGETALVARGRRGDRGGQRLGGGRRSWRRSPPRSARPRADGGDRAVRHMCPTSRPDICPVRRVSATAAHGTLPPHQSRESLAHSPGAPMPPRVLCPGGDHRPPATGGSCACGMVTRVPSRTAAPVRGRAAGARPTCATSSPAASTTARATRWLPTRPTTGPPTCRSPDLLRLPGRPDARRARRRRRSSVAAPCRRRPRRAA